MSDPYIRTLPYANPLRTESANDRELAEYLSDEFAPGEASSVLSRATEALAARWRERKARRTEPRETSRGRRAEIIVHYHLLG